MKNDYLLKSNFYLKGLYISLDLSTVYLGAQVLSAVGAAVTLIGEPAQDARSVEGVATGELADHGCLGALGRFFDVDEADGAGLIL